MLEMVYEHDSTKYSTYIGSLRVAMRFFVVPHQIGKETLIRKSRYCTAVVGSTKSEEIQLYSCRDILKQSFKSLPR